MVGAQRAGTTWLDDALRRHARIYLPERRKEIHYFDRHFARGPEWYARFFPDTDAAAAFDAVGEITPRYLYDPDVPKRVRALLPHVRLVAILRDPVERCRSHHGLAVRDAGERRDLASYLAANPEVIERGLYAVQLQRYLDHFPREQLLVLIHERVLADPAAAACELAGFLGVAPDELRLDVADRARDNRSYRPRFARARALALRLTQWLTDHDADGWVRRAQRAGAGRWFGEKTTPLPPMPAELRRALRERYANDRRSLEAMLATRLTEWDRLEIAPELG